MGNRSLQLESPALHFEFRPPADQFPNPKSKIGMTISVAVVCHNQGQIGALAFTLVLVPDKKSAQIIKK